MVIRGSLSNEDFLACFSINSIIFTINMVVHSGDNIGVQATTNGDSPFPVDGEIFSIKTKSQAMTLPVILVLL